MINFDKIRNLQRVVAAAAADPLARFVASQQQDQLIQERQRSLDILFAEAKRYRVRYLYVGRGEIAGCERKKDRGSDGWPAMWAIARNVGFPGSCGNGDQYQCEDSNLVFPKDSYGGWDLDTMTKLDYETTKALKFYLVVDQI